MNLHSIRLFNFSIVDIIGTILAAYIVVQKKWYPGQCEISFIQMSVLFILAGILVHWLLGIPTVIGYSLGTSRRPDTYQKNPVVLKIID